MAITYVGPRREVHQGTVPVVHCASDVHLGNARPTNDLTGRMKSDFIQYLFEVAYRTPVSPAGDQTHAFDLVLNGDIFDFWKAVPDPLPKENDLDLHSLADSMLRFTQILDSNNEFCVALAAILFRPFEEVGAHVIILVGNHDDPVEIHGAAVFLPVLLSRITAAAVASNLVAPADAPRYLQNISRRLFWGPTVYENRTLQLHVQHGHRWDNHNRLREDNGRSLLSEGQILVEAFINVLHDLNLLTFEYGWEQAREQAPFLQKALQRIDNLTDHLDAFDYIQSVAASSGIDVGDLLRHHFFAAFRQADQNALATLGGIPVLSDAAELLYRILPRRSIVSTLRNAAERIFNNQEPSATANQCRIALFGHSHIFDADPQPLPLPQLADTQYLNTGTWVEVLQYNPTKPLAPDQLKSYQRSALIYELSGPPRVARVLTRDRGSWAKWNDVRLP